jgi:hypothetical protein
MARRRLVSNDKRLLDWVKQHAFGTRDEGTFVKVSIRPVSATKKVGDEIQLLQVPKTGERGNGWEEAFVAEILHVLQDEANQLGGMQHFACYAVYVDEKGGDAQAIGRCVISLQGDAHDADDDGILSEPASLTGLTGQLMRHLEAQNRIFMGAVTAMVETTRRQSERTAAINEKLIDSRFDLLETQAEMLDNKAERDIEIRKADVQAKGIEEGISFMRAIAPVIVNKVVGAKILPEQMGGVTQIASSFFHSLTAEQMQTITGAMTREQLIQFFSLAETLTGAEGEKNQPPNGEQKPA